MTQNLEMSPAPDERLERLSALMDGETTPEEAQSASTFWSLSAQAQAQWQAWSEIGEGLRNAQAWQTAGQRHPSEFLQGVRHQLGAQTALTTSTLSTPSMPHAAPVLPFRRPDLNQARGSTRPIPVWRWGALAAAVVAVAGASALLWPVISPAPQAELVQALPADAGRPAADTAGLARSEPAPEGPEKGRPAQADKALAAARPSPEAPAGQAPVHVEGTRLVVGPAR